MTEIILHVTVVLGILALLVAGVVNHFIFVVFAAVSVAGYGMWSFVKAHEDDYTHGGEDGPTDEGERRQA